MNDSLSIKDVECGNSRSSETQSPEQDSLWPLQEWYLSVYEMPFSRYTERDLGIAVRQGVCPEHIIPLVIDLLEKNPEAGFGYDGELIESLRNLDDDFWRNHPKLVVRLKKILEMLPTDCDFDLAKLRQTIF